MVRFLLLFIISMKCFSSAIISSPLTEISKGNYQFKILFINETSRIPYVNFDITNGMLVRRSHSRTIRGYELSFLLKKRDETKKLVIENIFWIKNGKRQQINSMSAELKNSAPKALSPYLNNKKKKLYNSQTKILTEIDSGDFFFHKGIIIKYSILSKNTFIDYKISKFPKYTGFIKRFREISSRSKQIFIDGEYWYQTPLYLVEIFPIEGEDLKVFPMAVELKTPAGKLIIESEKFTPSVTKEFNEDVLYGDNNLRLFPGEGNTYDANHPVSILVEISGKGLIENYEPELNEELRSYLVDKAIEKQNYAIPQAKKVINYRFKFPSKGSYEGNFSIKMYDPESKKIVSMIKDFSFDILAPKKSKNNISSKEIFYEYSWLKLSILNSVLVFLIVFSIFYKSIKAEVFLFAEALRAYQLIKHHPKKTYSELFKLFYANSGSVFFNLKKEGKYHLELDSNGLVREFEKIASRGHLIYSRHRDQKNTNNDFSFIFIYKLVRRFNKNIKFQEN